MQVHHDLTSFQATRPVVTIGVFDGVHRGHRKILHELIQKARELNGTSVVITLWPHPRIVLQKDDQKLGLLNSLDEKIALLNKTGIDHLVILPFTRSFANQSSCDFIKKYLVDKMGVHHLVVGFNHHFGKDRDGGFSHLQNCASEYQFTIERMTAEQDKQNNISSTLIRNYLQNDNLQLANKMLGAPYILGGKVITGNKIGRTIGFPTANITPPEPYKLIPADGVYAVEVELKGVKHAGMLNIGTRPTINNIKPDRHIEVHLLNFNGDIYNEHLNVSFYKKIRNEIKFNNLMELATQLEHDKIAVKTYFAELPVY